MNLDDEIEALFNTPYFNDNYQEMNLQKKKREKKCDLIHELGHFFVCRLPIYGETHFPRPRKINLKENQYRVASISGCTYYHYGGFSFSKMINIPKIPTIIKKGKDLLNLRKEAAIHIGGRVAEVLFECKNKPENLANYSSTSDFVKFGEIINQVVKAENKDPSQYDNEKEKLAEEIWNDTFVKLTEYKPLIKEFHDELFDSEEVGPYEIKKLIVRIKNYNKK